MPRADAPMRHDKLKTDKSLRRSWWYLMDDDDPKTDTSHLKIDKLIQSLMVQGL